MTAPSSWISVALTLSVIGLYEAMLLLSSRRSAGAAGVDAPDGLRAAWFRVVSGQAGSEVLAVQTLRNSLMSATMLASTTALALMASVTLAVPSLQQRLAAPGGSVDLEPRLVLELVLLVLLSASLMATLLAVRLFNNASFIGGMPVASPERARWTDAGVRCVRRAGELYGLGLRQLVLVVPVVVALLAPAAGPVVAALVAAVLLGLGRVGDAAAPR